MSALASLVHAYNGLLEGRQVPFFGYSLEKIGFEIVLCPDGTPTGYPTDRREGEGKSKTPMLMPVPQPKKRTLDVAPNFLWDKTSYALGVTAGGRKRTAQEHAAFVTRHREALQATNDEGLRVLLRFLDTWRPEDFERLGWPEEMKDQNIVFSLESDRGSNTRIHDRAAARTLWASLCAPDEKTKAACLVTGEHSSIARLHPAIKGVSGAQSAGASIVSFNLDAFRSYGHNQGDNAPVSEFAAFAYTSALNFFLDKGNGHRVQIGDASTVFWANASQAHASEATNIFAALLGVEPVDEMVETKKVGAILEAIRQGKPVMSFTPDLPRGVRFHVLALAPNAARLSVRFYIEDDFGALAARYLDHVERMRISPPPREDAAGTWRLLIETAVQRKSENIPPRLAGDWLRAVLVGTPYPLTMLSTILARLRADRDVNAVRVGILKSVLIRNFDFVKEAPVALDRQNLNPGYLLGRLFATYEYLQTQSFAGNLNATIRDQYYGAASATPRSVFPLLQRKATHHLAKLRKDKPGLAINLDRKIGEIFELASPDSLFVRTLNSQFQALFAIGYYHQRNDFYRRREGTAAASEE
ncbi:type I-C CRISPR-associated protein Cas8c/Csd1 [Methylosinus sp. R-45379]|uniref:type I-C CRISPR-associated protein Cas8c/Csd1 n=1 Tax=Methylosinus sp. R-45379 TaxID=980563 RepID=UPI0007C8B344|nr:type I-C CRISPR-associated protein Cas8c/Csd1 [Methylosinus sp. R-45379]OAI23405.1 type I-C CRISPR-associated protein Cas8c/Csd1 [Methylosinus sp. R-45379]